MLVENLVANYQGKFLSKYRSDMGYIKGHQLLQAHLKNILLKMYRANDLISFF